MWFEEPRMSERLGVCVNNMQMEGEVEGMGKERENKNNKSPNKLVLSAVHSVCTLFSPALELMYSESNLNLQTTKLNKDTPRPCCES